MISPIPKATRPIAGSGNFAFGFSTACGLGETSSSPKTIPSGVSVGVGLGLGDFVGTGVRVGVGVGVLVSVGAEVGLSVGLGVGDRVGVGPVILTVSSFDQSALESLADVYLPTLNKYSPGPVYAVSLESGLIFNFPLQEASTKSPLAIRKYKDLSVEVPIQLLELFCVNPK